MKFDFFKEIWAGSCSCHLPLGFVYELPSFYWVTQDWLEVVLRTLAFPDLHNSKGGTSQGASARAGSSWRGEEGDTYLSVPSWNRHKVPRRSGAPTGGTGRAAASRHTVAAGGPASAAACQGRGGPAELILPHQGSYNSCEPTCASQSCSPSCQLRGHGDHGSDLIAVETEAQTGAVALLGSCHERH